MILLSRYRWLQGKQLLLVEIRAPYLFHSASYLEGFFETHEIRPQRLLASPFSIITQKWALPRKALIACAVTGLLMNQKSFY